LSHVRLKSAGLVSPEVRIDAERLAQRKEKPYASVASERFYQ